MACHNGHLAMVELLVDLVDLDRRDAKSSNFTPLHYACQQGCQDVVQLLLDKGADANARADRGTWMPCTGFI